MEGIPVYFRVEVRGDLADSGLWADRKELRGTRRYEFDEAAIEREHWFGLWFAAAEAGQDLEVRIGFSLRNLERCREALGEAAGQDLGAVAALGAQSWDAVLGRIEVEGGTAEMREIFYSAFYHATLKPADFRDENPFSADDGPFFFDLATLWDLYKHRVSYDDVGDG